MGCWDPNYSSQRQYAGILCRDPGRIFEAMFRAYSSLRGRAPAGVITVLIARDVNTIQAMVRAALQGRGKVGQG